MSNRIPKASLLCAVLRLAMGVNSSLLWAQFTSSIDGTVTDPSRAVVPKATLTLENLGTGAVTTLQTSGNGYFRFAALPAATFKLTAAAPGFKTTTISELQLEVAQTRTVNVALEVGTATTAVVVEAQLATVDLTESRVSGVIESRQLTDLPIPGRNFLALIALTPGVTGDTGRADVFGSEPQIGLNAAGQRGEQNGFAVDSGSVTSMVRHGRTNLQPNAEAIQEMRVTVNNFSAEHGGDAGAAVNVVTRSGSNAWHGVASWFHANNVLQSRGLFQNTKNANTGRVLPVSRRNEWIGSLGGPLRKNRTFFFGSFDLLRQAAAANDNTVVETPQFVDFVAQRFPNNKSALLLKNYPAAFAPYANFRTAGTILGANCASLSSPSNLVTSPIGMIPCNLPVTGEGVTPITSPRAGTQWSMRVDHLLGNNDRLYGSVFRNIEETMDGSTIRPQFRVHFPIMNWYGNLNETHTFSAALLNEFRATFVRVHGEIRCAECNLPDTISIAGGMANFGKGGPVPFIQNNYHVNDVLSWIRGSHSLKAGFTVSKLQSNWKPTASYQRPIYSFNNVWDFVNDDPFSQANIGLNPVDGSVYTADVAERQTTISAFVDDSWKVRPNLSLQFGLRWESYGKVGQETLGNNVAWRGGNDLLSRIADGKNATGYNILDNPDMNNFATRLSAAWDPTRTGKLSIRGGAGIFYDTLPSQLYGGGHYTPPIYMIITASKQTAPLLPVYGFGKSSENPYQFPRPAGLERAVGLDERNGSTYVRANISWVDPNLRNSYTMNYFTGIQYALTSTTTVEGNYVGNLGRKLYGKWNMNRFAGDLLTDGVLTRLNPSFGNIDYGQSNLNSAYNGGNFSIRQRASRGLLYQAAYTFGRALDYGSSFSGGSVLMVDVTNNRLNRALADHHRARKLAFAAVYEIPAPGQSAFAKHVAGGWQVSGVGTLQSGGPFTVTCSDPFRPVRDAAGRIVGNSGCDYNADGATNDRPHAPAFGNSLDMSKPALLSGVFTRAAFPAPGFGQTGSLGRNTFTNPGLANVDLALMRIFKLPWFVGQEGARLQVRAEAFNAFNRVNLNGISSNMNSATFGRVTGTGAARRFQFGVRLSF
jgi:hypothetical protein